MQQVANLLPYAHQSCSFGLPNLPASALHLQVQLHLWIRNLGQECYQGEHLSVYLPIGIACTILFALLPPIASAMVMYSVRHELDEYLTLRVYGFIYRRFRCVV